MPSHWMTARALFFTLLLFSLPARAQDAPSGPLPRCAVCEREVPGLDQQGQHRGRTVHLCSGACAAAWHADPSAYFSRLQPRGAIFQESAHPRRVMPRGGFWLGLYVLVGLVFGAVTAYAAIHRRHSARTWFFAGLFFNVVGLAALLMRPMGTSGPNEPSGVPAGLRKVPLTHEPATCPTCGYANHPSGQRCNHCETPLTPTIRSEVEATEGRA